MPKTIKVLHFADLHIGVENYGRMDPATGLSTRLGDFLHAFDRVVDYALNNEVHLVLFAGDAYKTRDPSPTHQREFAERIGTIGRAGIPVVLLAGNHDVSGRGKANTIEIFETLQAENIYVSDKPEVLCLDTEGGKVQVVTMPWSDRSVLPAKEKDRHQTIAQMEQNRIAKVEYILAKQIEGLEPDIPSILLAHATVSGAAYGSERKTMLGQETLLPVYAVSNLAFDYVALGHIHKYQVLSKRPLVVYAGSIERIDFGEEKDEKGFVVADISKGMAKHQFISTHARRFVTIDVKVGKHDPMAVLNSAIARADVAGAIVRVIAHLEEGQEIDRKELQVMLSDAFYVASVNCEVERVARQTRLGTDAIESKEPRELLQTYFEDKGTKPNRIRTLMKYADAIMEEVDNA